MEKLYSDAVIWLTENSVFSSLAVEEELLQRFPLLEKSEVKKRLGLWLFEKKNAKEALELLTDIGLVNDALCTYVAACIQYSLENYVGARKLFIHSVQQDDGYTRSYYWLGYIYQYGLGVDADIKRALEYYKKGGRCGYIYPRLKFLQLSHYSRSKITIFEHFKYLATVLPIMGRAALIAIRNIDDERLADINKFKNS